MRLSAEQVKEGILHADRDVREAAVYYFAHSYSPDPAVMPLVIRAIERHGFYRAFETYTFMDDLAQTGETVRWLLRQIVRVGPPAAGRKVHPLPIYASALVHADARALQPHEDEIMSLKALDDDARDAISERIWFLSRPPAELWGELEEFCQTHAGEESVPPKDFDFACRLVEVLGRHPAEFADRVLAILSGDSGDFDNWMEGFAVRLAGEMRLQAAVSWLLEMLNDPRDSANEECDRALTKIGTDAVVAGFAKACPTGEWILRMSAACSPEEGAWGWRCWLPGGLFLSARPLRSSQRRSQSASGSCRLSYLIRRESPRDNAGGKVPEGVVRQVPLVGGLRR